MRRTIKGRLTISVIIIVVAIILLTTVGIISVAGSRLIDTQKDKLQIQADKYAEKINTWIESEMMMATGTARSIEVTGDLKPGFLQKVVDTHAKGRDELLNLYCGTSDSRFYQSNPEAKIPKGYDPVQRGWYQQAAEAGKTIVTDPYWDVLTNQMCATIASPVMVKDKVVAVIGADVTLTTVTDLATSIRYEDGVYGFLADSSNNYIAHKNDAYEPTEDTATAVQDVMPDITALLTDTGSTVIRARDYDGVNSYFAAGLVENCNWKLGIVIPASNIMATVFGMILVALIIAVIAIVLVVVIMTSIIGKMLAPIQTLKTFASGDFSENARADKTIPKEYKNETEQIQVATAKVKKQMRGIILNTKGEAERIGQIAENASERMSALDANISQIKSAVSEVFQDAAAANELSEGIHATGEELGNTVEQVAQKASQAAVQSSDILERARELYKVSVDSSEQANRVYDETKVGLEKAISDSRRVDEINNLTEEILAISAQTNLLALNASIEAARAGESGKGFAVVAEEIRTLADDSRQAVDKIKEVTEAIVGSVSSLSDSSEKLLNFMNDKVVEDYKHMISTARQYEEDAQFYNEMSSDLGTSSEEMSVSMAGVNESITSINQLIAGISEYMKNISDSAGESSENSGNVLQQVEHLSNMSEKLSETVAAFRV
ncbi:MAG: methyl-accepting chemotaxis protein [Lachnospiraceae bacterium]|nr:methyl-accepting chemotaxis protein [Lachnospiraceae bacterium]